MKYITVKIYLQSALEELKQEILVVQKGILDLFANNAIFKEKFGMDIIRKIEIILAKIAIIIVKIIQNLLLFSSLL